MTKLQREWFRILGIVLVFFTSFFMFLYRLWEPAYALRWLGLASVFVVWQFAFLWRKLHLNRRADEEDTLPSLGWANRVSFLRGIFIAALFGFLFSPWPDSPLSWLPFTFYLFAALSDILDGYLARITNHVTELGGALDMENDSWGVLIVTGLEFWYGQVPAIYLLVGLARYLFVFGLQLREKQGKQNVELPFSFRRRIFAGVQMGFIVALLAPVFPAYATKLAAILFMLPFLTGFLYDWLIVIGWITPEKGAIFFERIISVKLFSIIPLALRLVVVFILLGFTLMLRREIFREYSLFLAYLWVILSFFSVPMLFFGVAGRLGAVFALISAGMAVDMTKTGYEYALVILFSSVLLFTGTGALSLWSPEDWLIYNRAGGWDD